VLRITAVIATTYLACIFAAGSADARAHYAIDSIKPAHPYNGDSVMPVAITDEGNSVGSIFLDSQGLGYSGIGKNSLSYYDYCGSSGAADDTAILGISPYSLNDYVLGTCGVGGAGFLYDVSTNTVTRLPYLNGAPVSSVAGVNAGGIVVGNYLDRNSIYHGYYFIGSTYASFDPPGSIGTFPLGINLGNTTFGYYQKSGASFSGFLLDEFGDYTILNAPEALVTQVNGVNNNKQAAGLYTIGGPILAFFWQNNSFTMLPLSAPSSQATAINENGIVAGTWVDTLNVTHGFVWNPATVSLITVYSPSGGSLYITGINNANQITGYYNAVVKGTATQVGFTGTCKGKGCF
jgi:hypothetical protein